MRFSLMLASMLVLAACGGEGADQNAAASTEPPAETAGAAAAPAAEPAPAAGHASADGMTPMDPGGFTEDGFVFHTRPGAKHLVRLPAPGTDTWKPAASAEPAAKELGSRKETTPEGKAAIVFEYEMLQSGNAEIEFQRLEDGEVEGKRIIKFMVH